MSSQELVKRENVEADVERSMRHWFTMKQEYDQLSLQLQTTQQDLVQSRAETAVLHGRLLDLELKYEKLLITYTRMCTMLETIGAHGDTLSLTISEILSTSRADPDLPSTEPQSTQSTPSPEPQPQERPEVTPLPGETIQELARRLDLDTTPPPAATETGVPPPWPSSNSTSQRPSPTIPPTGTKKGGTPSSRFYRK